MRRFASLCAELSASSATEARLAALQRYLAGADPATRCKAAGKGQTLL
jgi:hypothetical protein